MVLIGHGTDLSLAPTIGPLVKQQHKSVRQALGQIARAQYTSVQLDATLSGIRPRELTQRGRKELNAVLIRSSLQLTGLDFFIPRAHYHDPQHLDRAMTATVAAIELAADLGRVPLSLNLPIEQMNEADKSYLIEASDGCGVTLAVHDPAHPEPLLDWIRQIDLPTLGAAIDPAEVIARGGDPVALTHKFGDRLRVARLDDLETAPDDVDQTHVAVRCHPGSGMLDLQAYRIALDLLPNRMGPVVLDLRGLTDLSDALNASRTQWDNAAFTL